MAGIPEEMTESELDLATMAQMARHGSPFFSRLGVALGFATFPEMEAVREAFPHVWATYREMARRVPDVTHGQEVAAAWAGGGVAEPFTPERAADWYDRGTPLPNGNCAECGSSKGFNAGCQSCLGSRDALRRA